MFNRLKTTVKALWPVAVAYFKATHPQYALPIDIADKAVRDAQERLENEHSTG